MDVGWGVSTQHVCHNQSFSVHAGSTNLKPTFRGDEYHSSTLFLSDSGFLLQLKCMFALKGLLLYYLFLLQHKNSQVITESDKVSAVAGPFRIRNTFLNSENCWILLCCLLCNASYFISHLLQKPRAPRRSPQQQIHLRQLLSSSSPPPLWMALHHPLLRQCLNQSREIPLNVSASDVYRASVWKMLRQKCWWLIWKSSFYHLLICYYCETVSIAVSDTFCDCGWNGYCGFSSSVGLSQRALRYVRSDKR